MGVIVRRKAGVSTCLSAFWHGEKFELNLYQVWTAREAYAEKISWSAK